MPCSDRCKNLYRYLRTIGAKTTVVEVDYTDGDYLEDYALFYSKCHDAPPRLCARLHFFSFVFSHEEIGHLVEERLESAEESPTLSPFEQLLRKNYLGFLVVRPLTDASVGRTVLKPGPMPPNVKRFRTTIASRANLFGIDLEIWSVPYQEQDKTTAACATVALWSSLHKTAEMFGNSVPRTAIITQRATGDFHFGRSLPSRSLQVEEICSSIRSVGLEPEVIDFTKVGVSVLSSIYAYVRFGIPPILIGRQREDRDSDLHAVTVIGYSLGPNPRVEERRKTADAEQEYPPLSLRGGRIQQLYVHDDQVSPFARLRVESSGNLPPALRLDHKRGTALVTRLWPETLVIPVYPKIRISFTDIQQYIYPLDGVLKISLRERPDYEWDVDLLLSNTYKQLVRSDAAIPSPRRTAILLSQYPRFLWRAVFRVRVAGAADFATAATFLFDATSFEATVPAEGVLWQDDNIAAAVGRFFKNENADKDLKQALGHSLLQTLAASVPAAPR
jgi:hypothetical protein